MRWNKVPRIRNVFIEPEGASVGGEKGGTTDTGEPASGSTVEVELRMDPSGVLVAGLVQKRDHALNVSALHLLDFGVFDQQVHHGVLALLVL